MSHRIQRLRDEVHRRRRARSTSRHPAVIALDATGSDHGIEELLTGAALAVEEYPHISVICCGPEDEIRSLLKKHSLEHPRILVEHAAEQVTMHDAPRDSLRKKNSSVAVAARLVKQGVAAGMVSAGNTGATMATCMLQWRTLPGVGQAIVAVIPNAKHPCFLLDVGANVDCKPRHLLHFAIMGAAYAKYVYHRRNPRVGLLSIGEEETKGNEVVFQTQKMLHASNLNYHGNAEGRDLFMGAFDVIVCDGFVGNIVLKFGESLVDFIFQNIRFELSRNFISQLSGLAMKPAFRNFKKRIDHTEYGGAPLLGLHGTCVICHGSSRAKAIKIAIRVASELVGARLNEHIVELVAQNTPATTEKAAVAGT